MTPLCLAALQNKLKVVQYLVDKGADFKCATKEGETPLHRAAAIGGLEVVQYLVEKGADFKCATKEGETPLHRAAANGKLEVVQYLVEKGADLNIADNPGWTPLTFAAQYGYLEIVQYLVEKGADFKCADKNGMTPLHRAAVGSALLYWAGDGTFSHRKPGKSKLEVVQYLVEKGADLKYVTKDGFTPRDLAKKESNKQIEDFLWKVGFQRAVEREKQRVINFSEKTGTQSGLGSLDSQKQESRFSIQFHQKQEKAYFHLSQFVSNNLQDASIGSVKQGLYLPSFEERGIKINGKCTTITRSLSQALSLQNNKSFLSNLETSAEIYERIAQGKQVSKREEGEVFAFSKLLNSFERQLDFTTNSLPSSLIHNRGYKTLGDLSSYIAGVKCDFAIHLVTSNHVVAIYRIGDNYAYFDSSVAFVSGLKNVDQLMQVVEKGVESAGYKVEEKGLLVEHFDVDKANSLLSNEDKQILAKEIKTERQLLAEQDKELGLIKVNGQEVSRVQLYDFGTKINVEGSVPLLINANMNLNSKKFQDHLDKKEISMTAREYLDNLENSKNVEEVVQATKVIPFVGSKREIEEAEQTRKPKFSLKRSIKHLATVFRNISTTATIASTVSLASTSRSESQSPGTTDETNDRPESYLSGVTVNNQLKRSR